MIILGLFLGCTTTQIGSDFDHNVNFSLLKTYGFYTEGMAKLNVYSLDKGRMVETITLKINRKGFEKSPILIY